MLLLYHVLFFHSLEHSLINTISVIVWIISSHQHLSFRCQGPCMCCSIFYFYCLAHGPAYSTYLRKISSKWIRYWGISEKLIRKQKKEKEEDKREENRQRRRMEEQEREEGQMKWRRKERKRGDTEVKSLQNSSDCVAAGNWEAGFGQWFEGRNIKSSNPPMALYIRYPFCLSFLTWRTITTSKGDSED